MSQRNLQTNRLWIYSSLVQWFTTLARMQEEETWNGISSVSTKLLIAWLPSRQSAVGIELPHSLYSRRFNSIEICFKTLENNLHDCDWSQAIIEMKNKFLSIGHWRSHCIEYRHDLHSHTQIQLTVRIVCPQTKTKRTKRNNILNRSIDRRKSSISYLGIERYTGVVWPW